MNADFRLALRQLRKAPGFSITAILTLALAIGANAIVFSVLNAVVLHPLKVPRADSLFMVQRVYSGGVSPSQSYPDYIDLRDRNKSFESLVLYDIAGGTSVDTGGGNPSVVWPYLVSSNYFDSLGVQPYLGRFLHPSDDHGKNSVPYIVLSYAYWHSRFNGDPGAIGRTVQINKHPFTIVGVAPASFRGTELFFAPDYWGSIENLPETTNYDPLESRGDHSFWLQGHLKPGVTPETATLELNTIAASMAKLNPREDDGLKISLARPGLVGDTLGRPARAFMLGLMLLAGLILLAACANLGSLFAARAADRSREIAVRMALGSKRQYILRQLFTEAVVIALIGGAVGMAGAFAILHVLSTWRPVPGIPINVPVNPDLKTYLLALLLALLSGFLFGLVPVRQVMKADPWQTIRAGTSGVGRTRRFTLREVLLGMQIAICAVLITASLVAVRGLARSLQSDYGFQPEGAMLAQTTLTMGGYSDEQDAPMQTRMIEALRAIPGVTAVGFANRLPLGIDSSDSTVFLDSTTDYRPSNSVADAQQFVVSPDYFRAAGTTLLAGRSVTMHDDKKAPIVSVVNREFARKLFGSVDKAVGSHFKRWGGQRVEVVGVVEDGKYETLTETPKPAMFSSYLQRDVSGTWMVLRSQRDPGEIASAAQRTLHQMDPTLPLVIHGWNREMDSALFAARVSTVALGVLGALGAMLAITGIFGMASYAVSKRMREFGIRIALGANRGELLGAALGRAFRLLAIGSVAGILLGVMATQVLSSIVYQATPKDPLVLGGVILCMMVVGLVASWLPARHALAVDPMILLRDE
jgi:predicted permease